MTGDSRSSGKNPFPAEAPVLQVAFLLVLLVALWIVYRPGLAGPFVFDDYHNIGGNPYLAIDELSASKLAGVLFSRSEGISARPISMLSFAFNYYFSGQRFDTFAFKLTNLAIHGANTLLVFFLLRSLLLLKFSSGSNRDASRGRRRAAIAAGCAAALWGLHPLQLTSVLYVVQRMNSLSAFFVLLGLFVFVVGRQRLELRPKVGMVLMGGGLAGGIALGILSKENAILLPGFAVVVELVFFDRASLSRLRRRQLALFYVFVIGIPVLACIGMLIRNPWFISGSYINRDFTLAERLMTEARVLFFYLSQIFFPLISRFGLFHDDFQLSTGLLAPASTLVAVVAWLLILVALVPGLRRRAVWAFGIGWFLVGHLLESTVIGLELVHEHRNYLPGIGPVAAVIFYFFVLAERLRLNRRLVTVVALSAMLVTGLVTYSRASAWSSRQSLFAFEARHHPNSSRALVELANIMAEQGADVRVTYKIYRDAARVDPSAVTPLIIMQKMVQVLILATSELSQPMPAASPGPAAAVDWATDLVIEPNRLSQLDKAVSSEITRRLETVKPTAGMISFLQRTQGCALSGQQECAQILDRIIDWHQIVIRRVPYSGRFRAAAELSLARIFAFQGEIDRALEYADKAIASSSRHPVYRVEKAILLAKLGRTVEAEAIAADMEKNPKLRSQRARDLEIVRAVIRQVEAAKAPAQ